MNKMADTWWFEETKLLIALWSEEAVQHELNIMHNKKLVWVKISQVMADGGYSRSAKQCHVEINSLKQKYRKIRGGNKIPGNQRQKWEMLEPMDRVLGCKPTSKPTVVVDSMSSSSKEDEKISKVTYPDDGDEGFTSVVVGMFHCHSSPMKMNTLLQLSKKRADAQSHKRGEDSKHCKQRRDRTRFYAAFYLNKRSGIY